MLDLVETVSRLFQPVSCGADFCNPNCGIPSGCAAVSNNQLRHLFRLGRLGPAFPMRPYLGGTISISRLGFTVNCADFARVPPFRHGRARRAHPGQLARSVEFRASGWPARRPAGTSMGVRNVKVGSSRDHERTARQISGPVFTREACERSSRWRAGAVAREQAGRAGSADRQVVRVL